MKHKLYFILTILCITLISCNSDKKNAETIITTDTLVAEATPVTTVAQQASREGSAIIINSAEVPDTIRKTFVTKYPRTKKAEWYRYEPVADDDLVMDDTYYYVRFNNDGADYTSWYNNRGEWVKTSTKVPGNKSLPDPVNRFINSNYPGYIIEEISKENDKNINMYEIKMSKGDNKVKLKILPNGKLFKRKSN